MKTSSLGYLTLTAVALAEWRRFGTTVIGAMESSSTESEVCLKVDEHPFRIQVNVGATDKLTGMGWELESKDVYEGLFSQLTAMGVNAVRGDEAGAEKRFVTEYFSAEDPAGNPLEFYHERTGCGDPFESPLGVSGFVTRDMGLGHVVVPAADQMANAHEFYTEVLGFGDSDELAITPPVEGAPTMRVLFMHADNPRHHSLALFNQPVPTGIVHLMLEMENIDEVGRCLDRVQAQDIKLMATLGRHCNDNMLSFYAIGPGGVAVEIGCEGLQLDWDAFTPTTSTVPDYWGHAYVQLKQ